MSAITDALGRVTQFTYDSDRKRRVELSLRERPNDSNTIRQNDKRCTYSFEGVHKRSLYDDSRTGKGRLFREQYFGSEADYRRFVDTVHWRTIRSGKKSPTDLMPLGDESAPAITLHTRRNAGRPVQVERTDLWRDTFDAQGRLYTRGDSRRLCDVWLR